MPRPASRPLAVAVLALAAGPAVATAAAPVVSPQKTWARRTTPVALPGTGIHVGQRLPAGAVLVYRTVHIPKGEHRDVRLVVPKGVRIVTAAQRGAFGSVAVGGAAYVGRRSVTIRAFGGRHGADGHVYAYAR
ncbi:hypothetical protein [Patulibacter sp. SYSU D01012]|uniref:hypothetical protein n=1 Tax=Patulibacter sp. SYSU D01012 TaxID=2817381 RepID=UPI001B30414A|nr:hypothetical protein [Patulibacter sp. SYSU D01012]